MSPSTSSHSVAKNEHKTPVLRGKAKIWLGRPRFLPVDCKNNSAIQCAPFVRGTHMGFRSSVSAACALAGLLVSAVSCVGWLHATGGTAQQRHLRRHGIGLTASAGTLAALTCGRSALPPRVRATCLHRDHPLHSSDGQAVLQRTTLHVSTRQLPIGTTGCDQGSTNLQRRFVLKTAHPIG